MVVRKTIFICVISAVIMAFCGGYFAFSKNLRNTIISKCDSSLDCYCFNNIVKYRLTTQELIAFNHFLETLPIRDNVNILEFTDEDTAQNIYSLISLCRKMPSNSDPDIMQSEQDNTIQTNQEDIARENQIQTKG
ncbi:MAG: hypothetical protein KBS86_01525 [Proteobacteria bacterium]|nr:hypothetical protein [Candidatus Enterousia scatequi]